MKTVLLKFLQNSQENTFVDRRVTRGGRGGEVSPAFFWKSALILEKNAFIAVVYVLNFSFEV